MVYVGHMNEADQSSYFLYLQLVVGVRWAYVTATALFSCRSQQQRSAGVKVASSKLGYLVLLILYDQSEPGQAVGSEAAHQMSASCL